MIVAIVVNGCIMEDRLLGVFSSQSLSVGFDISMFLHIVSQAERRHRLMMSGLY